MKDTLKLTILPYIMVVLFLLDFPCVSASSNRHIDSLLLELQHTIQDRDIYVSAKEVQLAMLRDSLCLISDDTTRFILMGDLLDAFRPYNTDSALYYCKERELLAKQIGDSAFLLNAQLNTANVLGSVGMYKDALDIVNMIPYEIVPPYLQPYYYYIQKTITSYSVDLSVRPDERDKYRRLSKTYQDSLISLSPVGSFSYVINLADRYIVDGEYIHAVNLLEGYLSSSTNSTHDLAMCTYTLALAYDALGNHLKSKENLLIASISDLRASVREYAALPRLALLLFEEGDIENAYNFLRVSLDDAYKCNARLRIIEINDVFPTIISRFVQRIQHQQHQQRLLLIIISILIGVLLVVIGCLWYQTRKIATAYTTINEESRIKEVYIAQFMDQCSVYLTKLDTYRRSLNKLLVSGSIEKLKQALKSTDMLDSELKSFYQTFDTAFLTLFPTFVEDINKLLVPDGQIVLKTGQLLNTELRILALIRLGIKDSVQIAHFLRHSVTTIYNYRVKMRNNAVGSRTDFEVCVMKIGVQVL